MLFLIKKKEKKRKEKEKTINSKQHFMENSTAWNVGLRSNAY